jgi:GNAT superfamily N-acetyltransferase
MISHATFSSTPTSPMCSALETMQSTTEIKLLYAGDEAVLRAVAPDVFDDPLDAAALLEFLADPRHHLAVAIADGVVVGFVSAVHYVHPDKPAPELWINEVGVAPSHQGQGLARRLLETVLNEAQRLGCSQAWVLTNRSNLAAMRLYASGGGVEAPEDAVMFEFNLKQDSQERDSV